MSVFVKMSDKSFKRLRIWISFGIVNQYAHHPLWRVVLCVNIVRIHEGCARACDSSAWNEYEVMS